MRRSRPNTARHVGRSRRAGFTLIEAALTTVIVGTGVLSIVAAQQAYHMKNGWAQRTGTAQLLANELRELTLTLPLHDPITGLSNMGPETDEHGIADYDDVDDFAGPVDASGYGAGLTFNPPINALRQNVPDMDNWSQVITVESVRPDNISTTTTQPLGTTSMMRVIVKVQYKEPGTPDSEAPKTVTSLTWVVGQQL